MYCIGFFSRIFESGKISLLWKRCNITPVPKSAMKDPHVPINYRGISLLSCVGKMYSSLLSDRILSYCELCNILVDEQNGFRKNRSCNDHIFSLSSIIRNRLNNGKPTFAAFLEMEKAFDKVDRNLLLLRLLQYGIDDKMYYSIKNMNGDNIARVEVNNLFTDWFNVSSGVRQGDNLSPVLFNLYINDLAIELKKLNYGVDIGGKKNCLLLYADDIVIVAENESNLQIQLDFINQWCKKWRLNINHKKANVIHFRKRNDRQSNFIFLFGHLPIYTVQTYTYLGIVFDEHLTFSKCIKTRTDVAGRALGGLISKFQKLKGLGNDSYCKLYDSSVVPV